MKQAREGTSTKRGFRFIRFFSLSITGPDGISKTFEVPMSIYQSYFRQIATKDIKRVIQLSPGSDQVNHLIGLIISKTPNPIRKVKSAWVMDSH